MQAVTFAKEFIEFLHVTTLFRFVACPFFRSVITLM